MNDPRLDRQCEPREEYYASLILRTGMNLGLLESRLKQEDNRRDERGWKTDLALETLEYLAGRGNSQALRILRDYVRYGTDWVWVASALGRLPAAEAVEGIDKIMCRRIIDHPRVYEQFRDKVERDWRWYCWWDEDARKKGRALLPVCEPWKSLCRKNSGLAELFVAGRIAV